MIAVLVGGLAVGLLVLIAVWNVVRFTQGRFAIRWQLDIAMDGASSVFWLALAEVYYSEFPLVLDLGHFPNGFLYVFMCPLLTIDVMLALINRSSKFHKWYDEHYKLRRWNETYYNHDT